MRENRPYGSEGGEQRYCSPPPIGLCAHGAPPLYLDPGLRRDDNVVKSRHIHSAGFSMMRYPPSSLRRRPESRQMRAHGAPPLYLDPGLRRDDNVVKSRHIQSAGFSMMRYPPSSLRRRPESRQMRAHGAPPLYLDPALRRDDNGLGRAC